METVITLAGNIYANITGNCVAQIGFEVFDGGVLQLDGGMKP